MPELSARLQAMSGLNGQELSIRLFDVLPSGAATEQCLAAAVAFVLKPAGLLSFHGGPGNGKTMLLMGIVNECRLSGRTAVYTTAYDLASHIREGFSDDTAAARLRRILRADVVAVDELDKVRKTEWYAELETHFVDVRYRSAAAGINGTVFAMNAAPEDFLSDWLISRLRARFAGFACLENTDPDQRKGA